MIRIFSGTHIYGTTETWFLLVAKSSAVLSVSGFTGKTEDSE